MAVGVVVSFPVVLMLFVASGRGSIGWLVTARRGDGGTGAIGGVVTIAHDDTVHRDQSPFRGASAASPGPSTIESEMRMTTRLSMI